MTIKIADPSLTAKPGKHPAKKDSRTLDLSKYVNKTSQPAPVKVDWTVKMAGPWGMMENWNLSDCTCAAAGHMIECWTANTGKEKIIYDDAVLKAFIALTGYDPKTGKNDDPVVMLSALNYWRKNGIGGNKINAYASIGHKDHDLVRTALFLFEGLYVGLNLPNTIKGQDVWDITPGKLTGDSAPGSFGGHAVPVLAYDEQYLYSISWGKLKKITWAFWDTYVDELYAIVTEDMLKEEKTAQGLNLPALAADLLKITRAKKTLKKQLTNNTINMSTSKPSNKKEGSAGRSAGAAGRSAGAAGRSAGAAGRSAGAPGKSTAAKDKPAAPAKKPAMGNGGKKS